MLKDRKELLERELRKLNTEAADMYLSIVISNNNLNDSDYHKLKDKISDMMYELNLVNQLIAKGNP